MNLSGGEAVLQKGLTMIGESIMNLFLRFVTSKIHDESEVAGGAFTAAY
jgi:hypothetical protein